MQSDTWMHACMCLNVQPGRLLLGVLSCWILEKGGHSYACMFRVCSLLAVAIMHPCMKVFMELSCMQMLETSPPLVLEPRPSWPLPSSHPEQHACLHACMHVSESLHHVHACVLAWLIWEPCVRAHDWTMCGHDCMHAATQVYPQACRMAWMVCSDTWWRSNMSPIKNSMCYISPLCVVETWSILVPKCWSCCMEYAVVRHIH